MNGNCLCGAVTLTAKDANTVEACHCGMCRRWGGGPLLAVHCEGDIEISGEAHVTRFASSDWAERAFCSRCGSHLYYHLKPTNEYIVPAGLFQETDFELKQQIFIDRKPGYYEFANATDNLTEEQVFQQHAQ